MGTVKSTVVVAMSGGVDSAAAAAALLGEGYGVIGVTFRMWEDAPALTAASSSPRCSLAAVERAARTARALGIEHEVIDLRERFLSRVVEPFARDYLHGRTPNPCVECNRWIKFPTLIEVADELGADAVATGHYARACLHDAGYYALLRASDPRKDQSYVLYGLGQEQLPRCLFPNGDRHKQEVRETVRSLGMEADGAEESQEICFLCGGGYRDFISRRYPQAAAPGPLLDTSGKKLGEHGGVAFYTIGQRRGTGVSASEPLYVVALEPSRREVVLGRREEVPGTWLRAASPHWVKGEPPGRSFEAEAMVRYNAVPRICRVEVMEDAFELYFEERVWALTPGQHAVLYHGDEVLGGGVITSVR